MLRYVEKIRVPVRLALHTEPPIDAFLSLCPQAEHHTGPETILERLNARVRVLPFHDATEETVLLVVRSQIHWVMAGPSVASILVRPATFMTTREEHARVRTFDGSRFDGVLAMEMPHEFNRTSDFLNGEDDFFPLQTPTGTLLLNKSRLIDVRVPGAAPISRAA